MKNRIVLFLIICVTFAGTIIGQVKKDTEHTPDKNLKGSSRINPSTFAMEFTLPISGYGGRGGNQVPISLSYSSKIWHRKSISPTQYSTIPLYGTEPGQPPTLLQFGVINTANNSLARFSKRSISGWNSSLQVPAILLDIGVYNQSGENFPIYEPLDEGESENNEVGQTSGSSSEEPECSMELKYSPECGEFRYYENCSYCYISVNDHYVCSHSTRRVQACSGFIGNNPFPTPLPTPSPNPTPTPQIPHIVQRLRVAMPDGATVEFRKNDTPVVCNSSASGCQNIEEGDYLAVNGSGARLKVGDTSISNNPNIKNAVLYLPNGSRYVFPTPSFSGASVYVQSTFLIDVNGNKTDFNTADGVWTDTVGRNLEDPLPNPFNLERATVGVTQFTAPGMSVPYQITWKKLRNETNPADTVLENPATELAYLGSDTCQSVMNNNPLSPALFSLPNTFSQANGDPNLLDYQFFEKERFCGSTPSTIDNNPPPVAPKKFNPVVMAKVQLPNGQSYEFKYNEYGEITKIIYPTGAVEQFVYAQVPSIGSSVDDQTNRGVVERKVIADGVTQTWNYQVSRNPNALNTVITEIIAPDQSKSVSILEETSAGMGFGFENPLAGIPKETRSYGTDGRLISRNLTKHIAQIPSNSNVPRDARPIANVSITFEKQPNGTYLSVATMSQTVFDTNPDPKYFAHLNVKETKSYHFLPISENDAKNQNVDWFINKFQTEGTVVAKNETDYVYDPVYQAKGINSLAVASRTKDKDGNVMAQTETRYDEAAYPVINAGTATQWINENPPVRGNATTARVWDNSTNSWIETHAQFDNFGNARKAWDAKGNVSEVEFSSVYQFAYPTKTKSVVPDPSGQNGSNVPFETTTVYDFHTGLVLSTTDANGQTSSMEYNDPLLRPTKVIPPSGGAQTITEYGDTPGNLFVRSKTQIDATNWSESTAYFDGLGRTFKTQKKDTQGDVFTETIYDNMGRVKQVTNPFRLGETKQWSTTNYDAVGRVKEVIAPDGTKVESDYGISTVPNFVGTFVVGTDQAGKQGRSITNALGQLVRVDEPDDNGNLGTLASPTQPTFYNYSPQGQMVRVQQGVQNRFFLYDGLGRLIRVRQPEQEVNPNLDLTDPITGNNQWTAAFTYDISGNLITAKDAKNVTITSAYDNANRVLTRTYTDGTPQAFYKYDDPNIQFSKGKLTRSSNSVSTNQIVAFDNLGRVLASQQITDNNDPFTSSYLYNLSGALVEETYPSGRKVRNTFESDGDLAKIETQKAGFGWETRAQNFAYNSSGAISQIQIGNGLWETAQFNNRLQVTQLGLGTSPTDASVWKLNYEFGELDNNGNVNQAKNNGNIAKQTVTSAAGIFTQTYRYDSLERLKEAKEISGGNQVWIQNFAYDRYGNRIGQNQTINGQTSSGTPTVDVNTNRFTTGQGYVYDFAGNIVQDNQGRQFTFNGDNKQVEVKNAQNVTIGQYFYDADGKRIKKVTQTETTVFVYSSGKLVAEFTATNATPVAPSTQYFGTDMLESLRIITNQNAQIVSQRDFMPFGEDVPRANSGTDNNRFKFTTYQKDNETGLDFAEARYYNNANGRFTAVDPLLASGKSADPQTFNRYIYSLNSPLIMSDPSGLQAGWAYRDINNGTQRGTQLEYFSDLAQANKIADTQFGKDSGFVPWKQWTRGNYFLYESGGDRWGVQLGENGQKSTFSLNSPWASDSEWNGLVSAFHSESGISQDQINQLNYAKGMQADMAASDRELDFHLQNAQHAFVVTAPVFRELSFLRETAKVSGPSMQGAAFEFKYLPKHIEGSEKSLKLLKKENIQVFNDLKTLSKVESAIFTEGQYTGFVRGYHRFGVRFENPIGSQINKNGLRIPLFYGEMKMRPDGLYHIIPRLNPSVSK